jgi:hypothetical protein
MSIMKLLTAPIRSIGSLFRLFVSLFQLIIAVVIILWLQAADDKTASGELFAALDKLVDSTVNLFSAILTVKSFTKSFLIFGFMIAYVYVAFFLILLLVRFLKRIVVDLVGKKNAFWLRNFIARERGIAAYRAWVPFDKIRPSDTSQAEWETTFAWPADNKPPTLPLVHRMVLPIGYVAMFLIVVVLLQAVTPFPALSWIGESMKKLVGFLQ